MKYRQSEEVTKYIAQYDQYMQDRLLELRRLIQSHFPDSIEDISYGMPCYRPAPGKRGVIYFAAAKEHIGLYAVINPNPNEPIYTTLQNYKTGRGTLQFKNTEPLPVDTIDAMLAYQAAKVAS